MKIVNKIVLFLVVIVFVSCYKTDDVPDDFLVEQSEFTQKLLLEDYTGTWCSNCPKAARAIEKYVATNDKLIPIGVHFHTESNPEDMQNEFSETLVKEYYPQGGFPIISLNRIEKIWAKDYALGPLETMLNRYAKVGLAINSTITGNVVDVSVKVGYVEETLKTDGYKLVVCLLEDGLIYPQIDGGEEIEDYEHDHVLRYAFTNILGDDLPNQIADDHRYSRDFIGITLPNTIEDLSKLNLVAFVLDKNNICLNVQIAAIGENKDFD